MFFAECMFTRDEGGVIHHDFLSWHNLTSISAGDRVGMRSVCRDGVADCAFACGFLAVLGARPWVACGEF